MNFREFVENKKIIILMQVLLNLIFVYGMLLIKLDLIVGFEILIIINLMFIVYLLSYYWHFKQIITRLNNSVATLDQKFLIKEVQTDLSYEGELIFEVIEQISKSQYADNKKLKQQLIDERTAKTMWVHEMKQPLSILNNQDISPFMRQKALSRINKNLNQILYQERINNIGNDLNFAWENVNTLINENFRNFTYELIDLDAKINIKCDTDIAILTDKFWFLFVLEQLTTNAIKYRSERQLAINVHVTSNKEYTVIEFSDNGIGIEPHDLKNIFDQGYRGSNAKTNIVASGYGLYYVKMIMKKLNGKITIENNSEHGIVVRVAITNQMKK